MRTWKVEVRIPLDWGPEFDYAQLDWVAFRCIWWILALVPIVLLTDLLLWDPFGALLACCFFCMFLFQEVLRVLCEAEYVFQDMESMHILGLAPRE